MHLKILVLLSILTFNHTARATSHSDLTESFNNITAVNQHNRLLNIEINNPDISKVALNFALMAYNKANKKGFVNNHILTVIDYSLPSNQQRMWIIDMANGNVIYRTHVAHGKNSGDGARTERFSNILSSKESSLGTYITQNTYQGQKGYSLNLKGLDSGFNDNAFNRRVVVHGAWYMEKDYIKKAGRAGTSWGCLAVSRTLAISIIDTIKNGSVIFAYYPDNKFLTHSDYLT